MLQKNVDILPKKESLSEDRQKRRGKMEKIGRNAKIAAEKHCESSTTF